MHIKNTFKQKRHPVAQLLSGVAEAKWSSSIKIATKLLRLIGAARCRRFMLNEAAFIR